MKKQPVTQPPRIGYALFLRAVKERIRAAQLRATLSANTELIFLYWDIGHTIAQRQKREGWGAAVIPRLARDIQNAMPEVKGFSERNIKRMVQFATEYPGLKPIGPTPVAQLDLPKKGQPVFAQLAETGKTPSSLQGQIMMAQRLPGRHGASHFQICNLQFAISNSPSGMPTLSLKPTHKPVQAYYDSLAQFEKLGVKHESAVRAHLRQHLAPS